MKRLLWILLVLSIVGCANQNSGFDSIKTSTPHLLLTSTSTNTPFVTHTLLIYTLDPISATQQSIVKSCAKPERDWYTKFISSDYYKNGQWVSYICSDNGVYTKIINGILNSTWIIPAVDVDLSIEGAEWYWLPYFWSNDGKYLYLRPVCFCFIDSPWLIYSSGYGISRLDLKTGELDIWLEPNHWGYSFEFSNDGKLFAFYPPDLSNTIKIRNLDLDEEHMLSFKEKYGILEYRFTLDSSHLVFLTKEYNNDSSRNGFSIFSYDIKNDILRKLVDKNNLNFSFPTKEFIEPRIYISDISHDWLYLEDSYYEYKYQVNIFTGEIIETNLLFTPTPTP